MRYLVLSDNDIPKKNLRKVLDEHKKLYGQYGIDCTYDVHYEDMSDLPFSVYRGDSLGISKPYIKKRAEAIKARYAKQYDNICFFVAHENYEPAKQNIWGWAIASIAGYEIIQSRFETRSRRSQENIIANSLGTFVHETMHTHDSFVYRMIGKHIEDNIEDIDRGRWDDIAVHGKHKDYEYVGRKNGLSNKEAIEKIAPLIIQSTEKRKKQHELHVSLLQKMIELYRALIKALQKNDQTDKKIPVGKEKHAVVDEEDYQKVSMRKWYFSKRGYPCTGIYNKQTKKAKQETMHRFILNPPIGQLIDHKDGDTLNNKKSNLRFCTPQENQRNKNSYKGSVSKFKGVCWDKSRKKWTAKINFEGTKNLGRFEKETEAARAYNVAAKELHGEYARLNKV